MQVGAKVESSLGPDRRTRIEGVAYLPARHGRREGLDEAIRDALDHDESLGGDTALAAVDQPRLGRGLRSPRDVRVLEHDERVAAAELEHRLLQMTTRLFRYLTPGAVAAREGDRAHPRVGDRSAGGLVREQHRPKQSIGEPRVPEHLLDVERAPRHVGRVLQDPRIPGYERWRRESEHLPEREIPGHDREHRSERFELDVAARCVTRAWLLGEEGCGLLGVVLARPRALLDLSHALCQRLAHLERHGTGVRLLPLA